ncbi:MAG TPA: glycoside hydrolase family 3 C-terminal domain-containing protein, partial [Cytophagales bacterium]|nr:glycoside hydrolase family 3 C-terminal domain-containing protein [Cytophagales bacterium]
CTDWLPWSAWARAAKAGSDVMGGADPGAVGFDMASFINEVGEARINEAVEKILLTKFKLGVFEEPYGDPVNGPNTWHTPEKVSIVTDAARQSMTLLKNDGMLPLNLPAGSNLLVTGSRANDGESYSIWTSYFHDEYGAKTMFQSLQEKGQAKGLNVYLNNAPNPQAAVVIIGEPSYTHGTAWDKDEPYVHDAYYPVSNKYEYDKTTLDQVKAMGIPYVVVVIMPRPYVLTDVMEANSVLIAFRPGDGGGPALAQVLFGEYAPKGKLPWQLPRSLDQVGTDDLANAKERWDLPFDLGATAAEIQEIRSLISKGEQPLPIYGNPLFQYGYGIEGYGSAAAPTARLSQGTSEDDETKNNLTAHEVTIFPNPSDKSITIKTRLDGNGEILLQEVVTGKTILKQTVEHLQLPSVMDVNSLKPGLYILKISSEQGIKSVPFIKK